ncbi:MAG TPA: hypothetical protein DDW94_00860 [Deltaproteobacteria bacterium]|nr:MAG: hypothetical protein A2Z79_06225 [Deltaproteobacteria bacterium GWA2_55_82]OGQ63367.1 MAG: hypothetical protein A3I81_03215 [Deltaproteobacteria bacterium RIFCSPLOWO2_02_FULL_55_12]HBG45520.1 hypothetical protein [Deltaproteobacteria bacterium]HCY10351.1 hypothetical protein [Deltaproteobacteria bacterium]
MKPRFLYILVLLLFAGCGYHVAGKAGQMPGGVETLAIPVFTNKTIKPDIESAVTSAFVSEFVTTVSVAGDAPFVMEGVITAYSLTPVSFTKSDVNQEYRLTVTMSLRILNENTGAVIWQDRSVTDYEDFAVNIDDVAATKDREADALRKLSRDTARLVKERMMEGF